MFKRFLLKPFNRNSGKEIPDFPVTSIQKIIGYKFKDRYLLYQAFKHRSYLAVTNEPAWESNERLEFLGDAVVDIAVTVSLYKDNPNSSEGVLSKKKSILVSRKVLAEIVKNLDLGKYLLLNKGEEKTGGATRASNLANLYESIVGAIYLDGGLDPAYEFIDHTLLNGSMDFVNRRKYLNYKSILLEHAQARGLGSPVYSVVSESGPDHEKEFEMRVKVTENETATGRGRSKKIAEQRAAKNLLSRIAPQLIEERIKSGPAD